MTDETPEHWDSFLRAYGHAIFTAHLFEKHLGTLLWFLEARKHDILRRPNPDQLMVLIDELDGNPLGGLIDKLREYQIDQSIMELLTRANVNRIDLVHHFTVKFADEVSDGSDFSEAVLRVKELREPILLAHAEAQSLVTHEIDRMGADIVREREERKDPFRFLFDAGINQPKE